MERNTYGRVARSLDRFLTEKNPQNLVLGTSHGEGELRNNQILASPEVQAVLHKHGFYDIALEADVAFKEGAKAVAAGEMTPKELGESVSKSYKEHGDKWAYLVAPLYEERGKLIKASADRGTMVHFVDSQHPDLATKIRTFEHFNAERDTLTNNLNKAYVERYGLAKALRNEFQEYAGEVLRLEPLAESARREKVAEVSNILRTNPEAMQTYTDGIQSRLAYDSKLASSIMEITEGRKTVVMYGLTHGSGVNDLDEQLGTNTARIILVEDEEIFQIQTQRDYSMGNEQPEGYINTSNGAFVSGQDAYRTAATYDPDRGDIKPEATEAPALDKGPFGIPNTPQQ